MLKHGLCHESRNHTQPTKLKTNKSPLSVKIHWHQLRISVMSIINVELLGPYEIITFRLYLENHQRTISDSLYKFSIASLKKWKEANKINSNSLFYLPHMFKISSLQHVILMKTVLIGHITWFYFIRSHWNLLFLILIVHLNFG